MQAFCAAPASVLFSFTGNGKRTSDCSSRVLNVRCARTVGNLSGAQNLQRKRLRTTSDPNVNILRRYIDQQRWQDVVILADQLNCSERSTAFAASRAYDANEPVVASQLFKRMRARGVMPGPYSYSVMLKGLVRMRLGEEAVERIVYDMEQDGVIPDNVLLNSVLDAYSRAGAMNQALEFMQRPGYEKLVNLRTYNILMRGHIALNDIDTAVTMLDEVKKAGFEPNVVTLNTLINGCARAGKYKLANELSAQLNSFVRNTEDENNENGSSRSSTGGNNSTILNSRLDFANTSLLTSHAEAGRVKLALSLLSRMEKRDNPPTGVTYAALIKSCLKSGAVGVAISVLNGMPPETRDKIFAYNVLVGGLCSQKGYKGTEEAIRIVFRMTRSDTMPNTETYNELMNGMIRHGWMDQVEQVMKMMMKRNVQPDVVSYTILIRGYGHRNDAQSARRALVRMVQNGVRPDQIALNTLVAACCRGGDVKSALDVIRQMESDSFTWNPSPASYGPIISYYAGENNFDAVWDTYIGMQKNGGVKPNARVCDLVFKVLLEQATIQLSDTRKTTAVKLASKCAKLLSDACNSDTRLAVVRKYRRQFIQVFGRRQKILQLQLEKVDLHPDLTSASEQIFKNHGWNEIESGWSPL